MRIAGLHKAAKRLKSRNGPQHHHKLLLVALPWAAMQDLNIQCGQASRRPGLIVLALGHKDPLRRNDKKGRASTRGGGQAPVLSPRATVTAEAQANSRVSDQLTHPVSHALPGPLPPRAEVNISA